jgi:adenylate kinase
MADTPDLHALVTHLGRTSGLPLGQLNRLVEDVLAFLNESAEEFIRRRHRELQEEGQPNSEIFARIGQEAAHRRFRAPRYSERQIRRIVYG